MALYDVFSVHDVKADAYLPPFILPKEAMAIRVFSDCINSDTHQFGQHPADYTLFRLGMFDDANGQFLLERGKQSLGNGVEFLNSSTTPEKTNGQAFSDEAPILASSTGDDSP